MDDSSSALVFATWALVAATCVLAFVAAVPLIAGRIGRRRWLAANVVPEMLELREDLEAMLRDVITVDESLFGLTFWELRYSAVDARDRAKDLTSNEVIRDAGLRLAAEMLTLYRLLRQLSAEVEARDDEWRERHESDPIGNLSGYLARVRRLLRASIATTTEAEGLLPTYATTLRGAWRRETFRERVERLVRDREAEEVDKD